MDHIHQLVKEVLKDNNPSALATIVNVDGSAYRREGTSMVVKGDDSRIGVLSGGCLEKDLQYRGLEIVDTGRTEMYRYDLSAEDDLGWGLGAGCNGVISVMVRDIDVEFRKSLSFLNKHLSNKNPVLFIQSMEDLNKYNYMSRNGESSGNWQGSFPSELMNALNAASPFCKYVGVKIIDEVELFVQLIWPKPELFIIGAGEDARPLAQLAVNTGYVVHILDWRESLCSENYFPSVQSRQVGEVRELIKNTEFSPLDSVVIMTHDFQRDTKIMQMLEVNELFYLGILGSKNRTQRLVGGNIPTGIHTPVGLSISADGPAEIAVSIVAELIAKRSGRVQTESSWNLSGGRKKPAYGNK